MSLIRAATTVGGFTILSRVAGFVRDMLMARILGAGFASDAFLVAFRLPNLFRSLFAEGAFSAAFVPMVSARLGRKGQTEDGPRSALTFAQEALAILAPILLLFSAIIMLAAGPVTWAMTGGFDNDPEKLRLTTELSRLAFPYLMLISIVSLLGGVLNAIGRFWVNAAAPILLNLVMIAAMLFFRGETDVDAARALAVAVSLSGIAQLLFLAWGCHREGMLPRLVLPRLTPDARTLLRRIGPAALGAGALQINVLVSTLVAASLLPQGSVSYLYYADRLNQLPLGIIGIGMGVALLPTMSRLLSSGNPEAAIHQQNRAIEFVMLLSLPAAFAFIAAAQPILATLFQYGAFTAADTKASAAALRAFALGLPAYVLVKVLTPGFHARGDTRTPMRIAIVSIAANLIGNFTLIWWFGHVGIALANALAAWLNVALLGWYLHKRGHYTADAGLRRNLPRMVLAGILMAVLLWFATDLLMVYMEGPALIRLTALSGMIGTGFFLYFAAGWLFGAYQPARLLSAFRRG